MKVKYMTLVVRDMEESIRFYTEVMGFEVDSVYNPQEGVVITLLKGEGDTMIEVIKDGVNDVGFYSVGMDVEDLDVTLEEIRLKGGKVIMEVVSTLVGRLAFVEDPNGVRIALIEHS